MTQRVFDVENEKDMVDLWDIVPEDIIIIKKSTPTCAIYKSNLGFKSSYQYININFHDKTEITRPIQEATKADIGKLCYFWNYDEEQENGTGSFGKLCIIDEHIVEEAKYQGQNLGWFLHCRRLTKQEIEELC